MFCPNCGKELPDGALFCSECGQPVNHPQEQIPPSPVFTPPVQDIPKTTFVPINTAPYEASIPTADEAPAAPAGGMPYTQTPDQQGYIPVPPAPPAGGMPYTQTPDRQGHIPVPPAPPAGGMPYTQTPDRQGFTPPPSDAPAAPGGSKRRGRLPLILGIAAAVLVLVVIAVVAISSLGRSGGSQSYVYLTDDNELMFLRDLKEKTTAVEFSDEATLSSRVAFSPDGKYIYYVELKAGDSSGDLFRAEVSQLSKDAASPQKISNNVLSFSVLNNGNLIYRKDRSGETQVFLYSGEESYKLVSDVYWYGTDAKETYGYYTETDSNGSVTLSRIELKPDGNKETLIKRADSIFSSYTADVLLYGEADGTDAGYNTVYTLYSLVPGGEKERLVKDVSSVMGVTTENGALSFYYTTCQEEKYTLYDFVSDNMKSSDAGNSMEEPVYPNWYDDYYPWRGIYTTDDGREYYESRSGIAYYLDYNRYPGMDSVDMAYAMADDLYDEAVRAYDEQYDEWYGIYNRNNLREWLTSEPYTISSYTLYRYANGESTEIASRLTSTYLPSAALNVGVCFYNKAPGVDGKLADLADLEDYYNIYNLINESYSVDYGHYYLNVSGNESEFELDNDNSSIGGIYVVSDSELAISVYEDGEQILRLYSIGKDTLSYQDTIVEDYFSVYVNDGKLYYYTDWDYNRSEGDLHCYSDGKSTRVASEIYAYFEVGSAHYVLTDLDYDSRNGTSIAEFAMLDKDGKAVRINDEVIVGRLWFLEQQKVLYISDGDLYYWDGTESRRVASDVEYLWLSQPEESHWSY